MSLMERLAKSSTSKHTQIFSESKFFNDKESIPTDIPILNLALSGSIHTGLSSGLISVAAPSKHFKSNLSLFMVAAYMKRHKDAICLFYDSEFGSPPDYLDSFGIDSSRVLHTPISTVEELRSDITIQLDNIERGDKVIIFLDSIGNLASKKETEDAKEQKDKSDMTRAKTIKSLFRIVTPQLAIKDIPMIVINHVISTLEMFSKQIMTGGCLLKDTKIRMADNSLKSVQDIVPGESVKTLTGSSIVTHSWNPDTLAEGTPECIELTFDDGFKVTTSENHKFLCSVDDQFKWVTAKDLTPDHDVVAA